MITRDCKTQFSIEDDQSSISQNSTPCKSTNFSIPNVENASELESPNKGGFIGPEDLEMSFEEMCDENDEDLDQKDIHITNQMMMSRWP